MTTYKTSELTGPLLDAAVVKANPGCPSWMGELMPPFSTNWLLAGPIIEREHIELVGRDRNGRWMGEWQARITHPHISTGPTPLIAAMRAYCVSVFGEEVEL